MATPVFPWRSMLFVPVTNPRFVHSAKKPNQADAIQLDLEDSVALSDKQLAREQVCTLAEDFQSLGKDVIVRINRPWRHLVRDLEACCWPSIKALTLPKVPNAGFVQAVAEVLDELELERNMPAGHMRLILMIEDAQALLDIEAIAKSHPRVIGLIVGAEDLAVSMQMQVTSDSLYLPNMLALAACRAAGIAPIGFIGSVADYADQEAYKQTVERAAALGFAGAFCIHPSQIEPANQAYSPAPAALARARALLEQDQQARAQGLMTFSFEGRMVDAPVVSQAQQLVQRAQHWGL
ncbi:HpcH/HpaI aldolase/citrate lyase family protein [Alcaligenes endophyticus]|uniref:CoA ester lyase n=1 Tax=Alcaligenes endophyticus TaxID=1929088 RepID=A0ABT8EJC2_9BURK|nr:CoA ester lyase [Alcaligenes endophyticus]MCX5591714.1 CoA ester lyase [Alcaligenes endophyticus]MDN4121391.1 CoA ester lyase [Alcaligenes endophyticus]